MMDSNNINNGQNLDDLDLEKILEQRAKLDSLLEQKYIKKIVVMFTDLKDSTSLAEQEGDVAARLLIKRQNDILIPILEANDGILVKTLGDGTLSYFHNVDNALRAATKIQRKIEDDNSKNRDGINIFIRIGLHLGSGIVEDNDIFGDVVNVADRIASLAGPGEIYLSGSTFNAIANKEEFCCRFVKTAILKGKKDSFKIIKAYWGGKEMEEEMLQVDDGLEVRKGSSLIQTILLTQQGILIGRAKQCDIILDELYISREHARIYFSDGAYYIKDLQSQVGVIVNDKAVSDEIKLKSGDEITLGEINIKFLSPQSDEDKSQFSETQAVILDDMESTALFSIPHKFKLVLISDEHKINEKIITNKGLTIGRIKSNNLQLDDKMVSRHHARIWHEDGKVYIEDLLSKNGTFVDSCKITKTVVEAGQEIRICSNRLTVRKVKG